MPFQGDKFEWFEIEKFVEDGKHFSHDHPLRLREEKERDEYVDEEDEEEEAFNNSLCGLCGLPILSSNSYTCTITGCIFFIHQPCALKMTPSLIHHSHRCTISWLERRPLFIQKSSPNFTYKCLYCSFEIHPLAAVVPRVEIKIKHLSHPSHPLVAICRVTLTMCDVCGMTHEQKGFFFFCKECDFWVHQDCTILPKCITIADHPQPFFILAYSLPYDQTIRECIICRTPLLLSYNGVYFCPQSSDFAHVRCGMDRIASKKARLELVKMPDDEWDAFPSLVIRRYAERRPLEFFIDDAYHYDYDDDDDDDDDDDENHKLTIEKYHKHPLKILNIDDERTEAATACDLCTRPINKKISSSFYRCSDIDCHFAAHNICADTLPILNFFIPQFMFLRRAKLCPDLSTRFFNSIFYCYFCYRPSNGLSYYFPEENIGNCPLLIDLECMVAPSIINHASHPQHLLFRTTRLPDRTRPLTCCPDDSYFNNVYRCIVCDYYIHIRCATLPKRIVHHECDEHPLHLVFDPPPNQEMIMDCFCEVCEEDIDIKYWSYRCGECDKWLHVNCIPDVGYLSKVKFGGTLSVDHDHLMSLTRMLTLPTQRCGYCKKLIQGYVDEMAFSCSLCHFWIHFSCARDRSSTSKPPMPMLYSEVDD